MIDDLAPERIAGLLRERWGRSLTVVQSTGSTMDDALAAAAEGAGDGHVVLADQQTHGRGAHGRHWVSPAGSDLYFSVVARPAIEPASTPLITLATGLGIRGAIASLLPSRSVAVKWPNDIWVEGRKCAGILVESRTLGSQLDSVIIGIGVNVNRTEWPPALRGLATSLRAETPGGAPFDRAEVFATVLSSAERWVSRLIRDGAAPVVEALRPNLALIGQRVRWEDRVGVFEGIGHDGAALVRTDAGTLALHTAHLEPIVG